jgi:hypothetical protein
LASLGVSLEGRGSSQGDSVDCEPRHCASKDTLSELDFAHVCKCVLGRQHTFLLGQFQDATTVWLQSPRVEGGSKIFAEEDTTTKYVCNMQLARVACHACEHVQHATHGPTPAYPVSRLLGKEPMSPHSKPMLPISCW